MIPPPATIGAARGQPAGPRGREGFGGIVPGGAVAHGGEALVALLAVEHHADGAVLALLVLSNAPGALAWDPGAGLEVRDDAGRRYAVAPLAQHAGLGALQAGVWISPPPPPSARRLEITARGLARMGAARGGAAVPRPLSGGPWHLVADLVPPATAVPPPPEPPAARAHGPAAARHVPARAWGSFDGMLPVGQARITPAGAVCAWALERYRERGVLTLAGLGHTAADAEACRIDVWDDAGRRYAVALLHLAAGEGWFELGVEITPAPPRRGALALRLDRLPGGPLLFGVAAGGPP